MQSIKAIVIALAIVLLLGTGALIGVMVERLAGTSSRTSATTVPTPRTTPSPPLAGGFGQLPLDRPPGSHIRAMAAVGSLLVVHLGVEGGGEELAVIDPARGLVLGTIQLQARP